MTEKLYEQNALLKECSAVVTACTAAGGGFLVELDRTVLFPEGGGQLSDRGRIGEAVVSHVAEKDGHIYHACDRELPVGSTVQVLLDWPVRLDRMQQHLGEHLLSYACWKLFGANNVGFHMNEDFVTIDLDKELTAAELLAAERLTNEIIWENRPVSVSYMPAEEAAALRDRMRKFNSRLTGLLRIVAVQDADICTCCGTHPPFTGMLGSVKVIRHEKHKQGCRVEFLCGQRALADADGKNATLLAVAAELACKPEQVPERLAKLKRELAALHEEQKKQAAALLRVRLAEAEAEAVTLADGTRLLLLALDSGDGKEGRLLLPMFGALKNTVSVLVTALPERLSYMVARSGDAAADCRPYIAVLNAVFGGRGGGKPDCVQGGAPCSGDWRQMLAQAKEQMLAL